MNTVRCENGHFYDSEKYLKCPHCLNNLGVNKESEEYRQIQVNQQGKGNSSVLKSDKDEENMHSESRHGESEKLFGRLKKKPVKGLSGVNGDSSKTVSFYDEANNDQVQKSSIPNKAGQDSSSEPHSVRGDIEKAADYKPVGEMTVQFYSKGNAGEPVVGWLVCIEGDAWGKSYELKTGKNRIGRSSTMDIAILGDNSVSRDTHAVVMFEPHKKEFIMSVNECGGMVYINDEILSSVVKLANKDILTIGNTKLIFVPLCDEEFDWGNPTQIQHIPLQRQVVESQSQIKKVSSPQSASKPQQGGVTLAQAWNCKVCGYLNDMDSHFCIMCGTPK